MLSPPAFCSVPCATQPRASPSSMVLRCAQSSPASKAGAEIRAPVTDKVFSSWSAENKIDMTVLALTDFGSEASEKGKGTRGMIATAPLKKGDRLISVGRPTTIQVTSFDRQRSPIPTKISQETWQKLPWYAMLAVLLLDAKLDPGSLLQPWIQRLPTSFETPFHWSEKELLELQSPRVTQAVHEQKKLYRKLYDEINGNADNAIARNIKYSDFIWAVECVRSRAFSGPLEVAPFKERLRLFLFILANTVAWPAVHILSWEKALNGGLTALLALTMYDILLPKILKVVRGVEITRYALTPGIDLINHSSSVTGQAEVSYEYFTDEFTVQAGEEYKTGDQVFISYGSQSNDSLLQYYGFVEDDNPAETYTFGNEVEQVLGVRAGSLVARSRSGFDNSAVQAVAKKLRGNKDAARKALKELCSAELSGMPTTLGEDVEMLKRGDCDNDPRFKLAVRYRIAKKQVLTNAMQ